MPGPPDQMLLRARPTRTERDIGARRADNTRGVTLMPLAGRTMSPMITPERSGGSGKPGRKAGARAYGLSALIA